MAEPNLPMTNFFPFAFQFPQQAISPDQAFKLAVGNPQVPKFYVTNFTSVISPTEVSILMGYHGAPAAVVSLSYGVAKMMAKKLSEAVAQYEQLTGTTVQDAEELGKIFPQT